VRALVAGGAGFLGSHLVDRLVTEGHAVDVADDLSSGTLANLAEARRGAREQRLRIHTLDVRAVELADLLARRPPEVLYHLVRGRDAVADLQALANALDAARRARVGKVVVGLDAGELYDLTPAPPLPVKEGAVGEPRSVRAGAANAAVALLHGHRSEHDLEFTALAIASAYGPRQQPGDGVVASFVARREAGWPCTIDGDGRQARDFVYVDDVVDALVRAATKGTGLVLNVGTGVATSIRDLERLVSGPAAPPPDHGPVRPSERGRLALSPVRARIHLAWAPWTGLAEGIEVVRSGVQG
jgi:UDP-glucose 4-epimerase